MMKNIPQNIFSEKFGKTACIFLSLFFISFFIKAQDKIHMTDSTVIEAKVKEINDTEIKYTKFTNQTGPVYTVSKSKVSMVIYENGEKDIFNKGNNQAYQTFGIQIKDSLQFIENLWGVKFENTQENEGGVMITKLESNSIFKPQTPLKKLSFYNVNNGTKVRVVTTSQLAHVLFESYNQGISKINLLSGSSRMSKLSYYTNDPKGIDISGLSKFPGTDTTKNKLGTDESKKAGSTVSKVYHPGQTWIMQGFCSGMVFGLPGIALVGVVALLPPKTPTAPPNVDAKAWSSGYKSKIKKKRLISGLLGSMAGAFLIIGALSSAN
ncbi:MAG: hypothetical protein V1904_03415 [Bacteroidota bacterium]